MQDDPLYQQAMSALEAVFAITKERAEQRGFAYAGDAAGEARYILNMAMARFAIDRLETSEFQDEGGHYIVQMFSRPLGDD